MKTFFIVLAILVVVSFIFLFGAYVGYSAGFEKGIKTLIDGFDKFLEKKENAE